MAWTRKRNRRGRTVYLGCYRDPTGVEVSRQFANEREALRWAEDEEEKVLAGEWISPATRDILFKDWSPRWLRTKRGRKKRTVHGYARKLGLLPQQQGKDLRELGSARIAQQWNHWRVRAINRDAINLWVEELAEEGLSGNYIAQHVAILHNVLQEAMLSGIIEGNPCAGVQSPRGDVPDGKWLNADEVERLAAAMDRINPGWGTWVLVMAYAGLRWGEGVALRRKHVDLPGRRLRIVRAVAEIEGVLVEDDAKTTGPVDLPRFVNERLAAWMDERVGPDPDALVFAAPRGGYLRYPNFRRYGNGFDQAVRDCGWIPRRAGGVTPHVLRHSCATILIDQGAHHEAVKEQMRHSTIKVTFDVYGHLFPGAVADVWDRMEDTRSRSDVVDLEARRRAAAEDD